MGGGNELWSGRLETEMFHEDFFLIHVTAPSVDTRGMGSPNMPHMFRENSSGLVCLHVCSSSAVITITCLYTAGSSIRESLMSAHQPTQMYLPCNMCVNTYLL